MPAAGFVRQVLEQSAGGLLVQDLATLRAAVVGGFSAGGLRRAALSQVHMVVTCETWRVMNPAAIPG
jgi:hypothetical protein